MDRGKRGAGKVAGLTTQTLGLAEELARDPPVISRFEAAGVKGEARRGHDSLWLVLDHAAGAFALRTACLPGGRLDAKPLKNADVIAAYEAAAPGATFSVTVREAGENLLRVTTTITPTSPLLIPFWPRDLYPLEDGDPTRARGAVIAGQRGMNGGIVFLRSDTTGGATLYFQNLTALNPWFEATGTTPDTTVGGQWPECGYQPPASPNGPGPPEKPLAAGKEITLSDAFLYFRPDTPRDEVAEAGVFLDGLAAIYPHLDQPKTAFRDWPAMADRSLRGLSRSPKVRVERYGHIYLRPYTDAEVPDSMVQLAVLMPVKAYGGWRGRPAPVEKELRAGVPKFFDSELGTIRRFLPNVAAGTEPLAIDKDANEVDSWYLYHPLANLGRLALEGDQDAKDLLLDSVDYAIKVARHFKYKWPILFDVVSLKVHTLGRKPGEPGQTDVGGLYAYVMLQVFELTDNKRFLEEAKKAARAMRGRAFETVYQTNITAWGVMALAKLWKISGDDAFHEQIKVLLASFFHNAILWKSEIQNAKHYNTFLAATCLHDAPYMALYECFESFAAFRDYLTFAGAKADPSVHLLVQEYCRHTLNRAWFYYPSELPAGITADKNRNGHIDPKLAFPLEDLYADGRAPGEVGQEIYGAGAAFTFATRAFHRAKGAPFIVFCDYPVRDVATSEGLWTALIEGCQAFDCRVRILAPPSVLDALKVEFSGRIRRGQRVEGGLEFIAPGKGGMAIHWNAADI